MKKRLLSSLITGSLVVVCMFVFSGAAAGDTVYVDPNGSADFNTIQTAIDDVNTVAGDVVIVMPGTYVENINMSGKAITLRGTDPLNAGVVLATIIDGNASGSVITCNTSEGPSTVISGFLITNGLADYGAGMYITSSSPTVTNCTFSGNTVNNIGGGMICAGYSSATITNCTFSNNSANDRGGGMCDYYSSTTVTNCTFSNNSANISGGGFYHHQSESPTVTNCTFSGNTATYHGGGMYNGYSPSPTVINCTFNGNTAANGSGMSNNNSSPTVRNSILWGNISGGEIYNSSSTPIISYCNIAGGYPGTGNIDADPLFVNAAVGDYHLRSQAGNFTTNQSPYGPPVFEVFDPNTSPCIDAGDPGSDVGDEPEGNGGRINMGAYGGTNMASRSSYIPPVEGDVDGDGDVDLDDFALMAANWLAGK
jgi:parallel beta-helix repeat protein